MGEKSPKSKARTKQLKVIPTKQLKVVPGSSPVETIKMALSGGMSPEYLKEILTIQKDWEANEARKAYFNSMSTIQANIPTIQKTKKNYQTNSTYADLDEIIKQTKAVYTKEGVDVSFYEGEGASEGFVRVCADIEHRLGHVVTRHYDSPFDDVGLKGNVNKTKTHAKASAVTYGRRYLMCMIFNIPTGNDDDGNSADVEKIDEEQMHSLLDLVIAVESTEGKLLKFMGLEKLEDMPKSDYQKAVAGLEAKKK